VGHTSPRPIILERAGSLVDVPELYDQLDGIKLDSAAVFHSEN
jgi:hypothetical protein